MNRVDLIGRLTRDPELKYAPNGTAFCNFTVAITRRGKDNDKTDFVDCVCFGKMAENTAQYLTKGRQVGVTGSIQVDSYKDKDGNNRKSVKVVADNVEFIGSKGDSGGSSYTRSQDETDWSTLGEEVNVEGKYLS